jgi:putative peptidoglycan lipid II flippase
MKHILRSTLILVTFFAIDKALAFVRQVAVARSFSQTPQLLDAFNAANNLPDLLFALISGGALAVAFIPVLSYYLEKEGQPSAWDLFARIANLAFLVTTGLAVVIAVLADPLVRFELGLRPVSVRAASPGRRPDASQPDRHADLLDQWIGDGRAAGEPTFSPARHGASFL